jgi:hypothetical protein
MKKMLKVIVSLVLVGFISAEARENKIYVNLETMSGSNNEETLFGKQRADVIVGAGDNQSYFVSVGYDINNDNVAGQIGVTALSSPDNNGKVGFGFDFKMYPANKEWFGFKPYFGGKALMANQSRDGDKVFLSYNENMVTYVTGTDLKEGRYKAVIHGDVSTFMLQYSIGIKRDIGDNLTIYGAYQGTSESHTYGYRAEGSKVDVDATVTQGSGGYILGVGFKF